MRRLLLAFLVPAILTIPVAANLPTHLDSIKPLFMGEQAICTTWSLDQKAGLWVTAAHCTASTEYTEDGEFTVLYENLTIAGQPATVTYRDLVFDLALLVADAHEPGLRLGEYPKVGDVVTVYGYPGGLLAPFATWLHVSNPFLVAYGRQWMVLDGHVWPGHSGAPVLDRKGRVVGIVQAHGTDRFAGMTLASAWGVFHAFITNAHPVLTDTAMGE